jgi:HEAT repeat protein
LDEEDVQRKGKEEVSASISHVLQSIYTATKTALIYPPENPSVVRVVDSAFEAITGLIPPEGSLDMSFMEEKLVINGEMLDDAIQKKGIVRNFHELMKSRRISSITFWSGLSTEELRSFLIILGTKAPTLSTGDQPDIYQLLEEDGISHVEVDEQIFVAISKREKVVDARAAVEHEEDAAVKALKDEVFARFLAGEVSPGDVSDEALGKVMEDPDRMVAMVQGVISSQGWDTEVSALPFRVDETRAILERISGVIEKVEDPLVRNKLNKEVGKIAAQVDVPELTEMLLGKRGGPAKSTELPKVLFPLIEDKKLVGVVESIVAEYKRLASQTSGDDWPTPRMAAISKMVDQAAGTAEGESAREMAGIIKDAGFDKARYQRAAEISGVDLADQLVAGDEAGSFDLAKGPALVGAARHLFENGHDQLGEEVLERLFERFRSESEQTRLVAAHQIWGLFKTMRDLGKEGYASEYLDEISSVLDESTAVEETLSGLSRSMHEIAAGTPSLAGELGLEEEVSGISGGTVERLISSDTGKVVQAVFKSGDKAAQEAISMVLLDMEEKAVPALLDAATDAIDRESLESVASSLKELKTDPVPQIASRFAGELESNQKINLVRLLSMVGDDGSVSVLNHLMLSEDVELRSEVVRALGKLGGKHALQMVLSETGDPDPLIKTCSVRELGNFRDYLAVRRLLEIITPEKKGGISEDDAVVIAACRSLGDLNVKQAVPLLVDIARGGRRGAYFAEEVRAAATDTLGSIGDEESLATLRKLLKDDSLLVRSTARKGLTRES